MRFTTRFAFALLAFLALPPLAHAGPIRWGYRAESFDGSVREKRDLTDLTWSDNFLPDPRLFGVPLPDPDFRGGVLTNVYRSEARVLIIDEPTGDWGEVYLSADYVRQFRIDADGTQELIFEGADRQTRQETLTLRGNRYTVNSPDGAFVVSIEPLAQTPEPASLALAGVGLGAVLLRRARRA